MPTYEYNCHQCSQITEVIKSMSESESKELCPHCQASMERMISAPKLSISNCQFQSHYNHGLGKVVHSKRDVKNELSRIEGESGKKYVEVGNDTMKSIKKQRKAYTY